MLLLDSAGIIQHCNSSSAILTGFSSTELTEKIITDIVPAFSVHEFNLQVASFPAQSMPPVEMQLCTKEGLLSPVEIHASHVGAEDQRLLFVLVTPLTKRQEIESVLVESEQMLRSILNHHYQMTGLMDTEGRLLMANQTALQMGQLKEEDVVGCYFWDTPWFDHSSLLQNKLKDAVKRVRKGEFVRFETEHPDANGNLQIIDFSLTPLYIGDVQKVNYIVPEGRDITEIKQKEFGLKTALEELGELKNYLQNENVYLKDEIRTEHDFNDIIGNSKSCRNMLRQIKQVARSDANVIISGESGTGKELVARAIHDLSNRDERPLVKVNCAALPETLIESELFGHEKGAFTGAVTRNVGRFELADKGTIFLDEVGEIPFGLQAKLLRVLQEGTFERLGSSKTHNVNVRVVAATNRDLARLVREGLFREDLFYRLNVFPITCPPLRERVEDIPVLVGHFIEKYSAQSGAKIEIIPKVIMDNLTSYAWPGNIRELENIVERALIVSRGRQLEMGPWLTSISEVSTDEIVSLEENERRHILEALKKTSWRVSGPSGAAKILNINSQTLVSRIKKLGIKRSE
jgi:formate hydrogenlyase transcriptional activator